MPEGYAATVAAEAGRLDHEVRGGHHGSKAKVGLKAIRAATAAATQGSTHSMQPFTHCKELFKIGHADMHICRAIQDLQQAVTQSLRQQILRVAAAQDQMMRDAGDSRSAASRIEQVTIIVSACSRCKPAHVPVCARPQARPASMYRTPWCWASQEASEARQASSELERPLKRRRGLAAAVGAAPSQPGTDAGHTGAGDHSGTSRRDGVASDAPVTQSAGTCQPRQPGEGGASLGSQLTMAELSERLRAQNGHSLRVAPSAVRHSGAGDGLWLTGAAQTGAVVALYPGVVYTALHHRRGSEPVVITLPNATRQACYTRAPLPRPYSSLKKY